MECSGSSTKETPSSRAVSPEWGGDHTPSDSLSGRHRDGHRVATVLWDPTAISLLATFENLVSKRAIQILLSWFLRCRIERCGNGQLVPQKKGPEKPTAKILGVSHDSFNCPYNPAGNLQLSIRAITTFVYTHSLPSCLVLFCLTHST